jgi:hypothetical protein
LQLRSGRHWSRNIPGTGAGKFQLCGKVQPLKKGLCAAAKGCKHKAVVHLVHIGSIAGDSDGGGSGGGGGGGVGILC